ncbi:MAG: hypothetical protein IT454_12915 [Planctomycetes bacterium]|nr:hypothetical protein [Planctomycetota bacterium]
MNLRVHELTPAPRVVGPGRRERAYLERTAELERAQAEAARALERLTRELDIAERIERGSARLVDRLEAAVAGERELKLRAEEAQKRLLLALGAVQRDNQALRSEVARLEARARALPEPLARPRGLARLFSRRSAPRA